MTTTAAGATHTTREISQQPQVWREVGSTAGPALLDFGRARAGDPSARVVLTGAGTSAYAGEVLAPALRRASGRRAEAVATTDIVANPAEFLAPDVPTLLVSFARSGDSPESVAATALADELLTDVAHLVLTCNAAGRLAGLHRDRADTHVQLMPDAADDQGFAMTSSFTSMTLAALIALDPSVDPSLAARLADVAEDVLPRWDAGAAELARRGHQRVVFLGSGALRGLARESALKVLELTAGRVVALGDSPLAFRHGPKSVLDASTLVVVYLSNDPYTRAYDLDLVEELRGALGDDRVLVVTADHGDAVSARSAWVLPRPAATLPDAALALPAVILAQSFALHSATALGLSADNPFPSGEVNRVVQGVRIHPFPPSS